MAKKKTIVSACLYECVRVNVKRQKRTHRKRGKKEKT